MKLVTVISAVFIALLINKIESQFTNSQSSSYSPTSFDTWNNDFFYFGVYLGGVKSSEVSNNLYDLKQVFADALNLQTWKVFVTGVWEYQESFTYVQTEIQLNITRSQSLTIQNMLDFHKNRFVAQITYAFEKVASSLNYAYIAKEDMWYGWISYVSFFYKFFFCSFLTLWHFVFYFVCLHYIVFCVCVCVCVLIQILKKKI